MKQKNLMPWAVGGLGVAVAALVVGCPPEGGREGGAVSIPDLGATVNEVIKERNLTPDDVTAALKTFVPTGRHDDYVMFASGGHAGQVFVIGMPSMRLLRTIAVFTPEPWQGWGYGSQESMEILEEGNGNGAKLSWGDTHHPALSETKADYDGQFLFINDKANARIAVIDLRDFECKQIVKNPLVMNDHGGAFVTPNTEYVIEGGQYATPWNGQFATVDDYARSYRGMVTFWKFDREKGRIDPAQSFAMELPPYWQDLSDAGKGACEGWIFINSFNTEMATGGAGEEGKAPFEAGASQRDMDYLHLINIKKVEEVAKAGRTTKINGMNVITLETSAKEKLLHFLPEPKSPHGIDVTPGGEYFVVSGKLDPHVTVYSTQKMLAAIEKGEGEKDQYGITILPFDAVKEAQIELGLGPLHTQFDDKGYAYTSLFLDTAVARWTLGGPYQEKHSEPAWSLVAKLPVHYNVGHIACAEGDTASPDGKYLVSLNKWSVDRFLTVGPLLPQNFQLIDIGAPGEKMQLLYDMPIGMGEPHYAQIIKADKLKAWEVYPEIGWDARHQRKAERAAEQGKEGVVRKGDREVEVNMTAVRSHYTPEHIRVKQGDRVTWRITNAERAKDATHGFAIGGYNINLSLEPGEATTMQFVADKPGVFPFYCTEFCSALHLEMVGYFLVEPRE